MLDRSAALHSRCLGGVDLEVVGATATARVKHQTADTLELGNLTLRSVPILVSDRSIDAGIQGVLPLSIFSDFLIRLDFPGEASRSSALRRRRGGWLRSHPSASQQSIIVR